MVELLFYPLKKFETMLKNVQFLRAMLLILFSFLFLISCGLSAEPQSASEILFSFKGGKACIDWQSKRSTKLHAKAELAVTKFDQVVCVDGLIAEGDHKKFVEILSQFPPDESFALAIRSPGGETKTSLSIAEYLVRLNSSVFVVDYCASSCANYIMAAGKERYVLKDALLLFHGGVTLDHLAQAAEQIKSYYASANLPGYEKNIEEVRIDLSRQISRQEALLDRAGIARHLFRYMNLFPNMSERDQSKLCPPNSGMVLYTPEVLLHFNYRLTSYEGPLGQQDLDKLVNKYGGKTQLCFWEILI